MKAHINGITVEGTPQEIMEYQSLQAAKKPMNPHAPWYDPNKQNEFMKEWNKLQLNPKTTGGTSNIGMVSDFPLANLAYSLDILNEYTKKWDE